MSESRRAETKADWNLSTSKRIAANVLFGGRRVIAVVLPEGW